MSDTKLHFITGKGGVGKSTLAAAFVRKLSDLNEGPILLIDIQGTGHCLSLLGAHDTKSFEIKPIGELNHVWGCRIMPRPAFRQYFNLLLAMGQHDSTFAQLTSGLRSKFVDAVLDNKVVSAFVDVCPGLEPAALLGKVHFECTEGFAPETEHRWKHVVVDAPSTGHSLMLFKSTQALVDVFGSGIVFKQARSIMSFMKDAKLANFHIVSLPEELPLREAKDLSEGLESLNLPSPHFSINRVPPKVRPQEDIQNYTNATWKNIFQLAIEKSEHETALISNFTEEVGTSRLLNLVKEIPDLPQNISMIVENLRIFPTNGGKA